MAPTGEGDAPPAETLPAEPPPAPPLDTLEGAEVVLRRAIERQSWSATPEQARDLCAASASIEAARLARVQAEVTRLTAGLAAKIAEG